MADLTSLSVALEPLGPEHRVAEVGDLFLDEAFDRFLSLPVVEGGKVLGAISRNQVQRILSLRFGRDLHGNKPIADFMNPSPLVVPVDHPVEQASAYITSHISFPITEDFILTKGGRYQGVGSVIDLLRGMEAQLMHQNQSLAQAYAELQASQAQLVQSEKMASLGQMVAGVAHELNTPLGYVKNNIELAREAYQRLAALEQAYDGLIATLQSPAPDESAIESQFGALQEMRQELEAFPSEEMENLFEDSFFGLQQMGEIVTNLKNFSRLDQAAEDDIDLNACIDSALSIARNVTKHKAEVVRRFGSLPRVRCSPSQINQVVLNLVTNAAHAIEGKGRIEISTSADADFAHIVVKDNGKGIPQANLQKIFDPFFTTKKVGEGTGLGLSISFKIVQAHQGRIRVKSEVGRGTAFCVSLPVKPATPQRSDHHDIFPDPE